MRKARRKRKKKPSYTPEQVARLIPLIEEWTRYEIAARLLPIQTNLCIDYYRRMLEKEDEIRFLLYGSSDLPVLAQLLGMDKSEDDVKIRSKRYTPFVPDEERLRDRAKRERSLVKDKSRAGVKANVEAYAEAYADIEALLLAAGVT